MFVGAWTTIRAGILYNYNDKNKSGNRSTTMSSQWYFI